jgi:hypothetical protein
MFKLKINLDRHGPASYPNICLLPGPHCFSFPSTFNGGKGGWNKPHELLEFWRGVQ